MEERPFTDEVIRVRWAEAGGRCECRRASHNHYSCRCNKPLDWNRRGDLDSREGWEIQQLTDRINGNTTYEVLCGECYRLLKNKPMPWKRRSSNPKNSPL